MRLLNALTQSLNSAKGFACIFISAFLFPTITALAQAPSYDELQSAIPENLADEDFVVYENTDRYAFNTKKRGEVTAYQNSSRTIINQRNQTPVYFESTNSYSSVSSQSGTFSAPGQFRPSNITVFNNAFQYESNGIFHNDFFVNSLQMNESKKGIYTLSYVKTFSDYKFLASIPLYHNYPTMNSKVIIEVPADLELEILEKNFGKYEIEKIVKDIGTQKVYTYTITSIPWKEECDYCPSSNYFEPHLVLVYKSINSGGKSTPLLPDVKSLYEWYHSLVKEIDDVPGDITGLTSRFKNLPQGREQISAVNDWIKSNIRYIAFESGLAGFKPDACQKVYENRYGDCKGMANLCRNVLKELGYDARLAWIGTRKEVPYDYSIPSLIVDNHMITAVKLGTEWVFLDPTETYGPSFEYAYRIQGRPVLIEDGESYILTEVPENETVKDLISRKYTLEFDPASQKTIYEAREVYTGEPRKYVLSNYDYTLAKDREKALSNFLRPYKNGSFELIDQKGMEEENDSLSFAFNFSSENGIIDLGDEIYLDVDPTNDLEYVEFDEKRKANWFFDEKFERETIIEMKIPEAYDVSYLPKAFESKTDDFEVSVNIAREADAVKIHKKISVYKGWVNDENKEAFEEAITQLKTYYEDRVILSTE